jgi:hypothetical protein
MLPVLSNICITGNTITHHRGRLLHAHGVEELHFSGNRPEASCRYPMEPWVDAMDLGSGVVSATVEVPTGWGRQET